MFLDPYIAYLATQPPVKQFQSNNKLKLKKMSIVTPLIQAWSWFKKVFIDHNKSAASVAVTVTETVKAFLASPVIGFLGNIADGITHTQLPTEAITAINKEIPKVLAFELAVEGLPDNPTQDQILAFEQSVLKAFNVNSNNSKLYTLLSAQVYGIIQTTVNNTPGKFADWVNAVEQSWLDFQKDLADNPGILNLPVGTKLPDGNTIIESAAAAIAEEKGPNA